MAFYRYPRLRSLIEPITSGRFVWTVETNRGSAPGLGPTILLFPVRSGECRTPPTSNKVGTGSIQETGPYPSFAASKAYRWLATSKAFQMAYMMLLTWSASPSRWMFAMSNLSASNSEFSER